MSTENPNVPPSTSEPGTTVPQSPKPDDRVSVLQRFRDDPRLSQVLLFAVAFALFTHWGINQLVEYPRRAAEAKIRAELLKKLQALDPLRYPEVIVRDHQLANSKEPLLDRLLAAHSSLDQRIAALEDSIAESPGRAVSLLALQQKVDTVRERMDAVYRESDRTAAIAQWALGLCIVALTAVLTLVLGVLKK
jgi:uncharacterized protein YdcH (DUF465 family)